MASTSGKRSGPWTSPSSTFTPQAPTDGKYGGRLIPGVRFVLTDRERYHAGRTGAAVLWALGRTSPDSLVVRAATFDDRFGRPTMREALLATNDGVLPGVRPTH